MAVTPRGGGFAAVTPIRLIAALLGVLWIVALWLQPLTGDALRLVLLLIPDETVQAWFDGPTTLGGLADRAAVIAVAALVVGQASIGGWLLLRSGRWFRSLCRTERLALAAAFGLGMQANVTLALGLIGELRGSGRAALVAPATWGICLGVAALLRWGGSAAQREHAAVPAGAIPPWAPEQRVTERRVTWPGVIAVLFAFGLVLRAILPPLEYDVREYHLQTAKEWWQEGRIGFAPHNIYSNMPLAAESQSVVGMMWFEMFGAGADAWWWGALAGKVVIAAYAILTALLVGGAVRRWTDGPWAAVAASWGVVFSLAFPAVVEVASLGLIEPAVATYMAAGLFIAAVSRSRREPHESSASGQLPTDTGEGILAGPFWFGLAGGCAMACKYPAALLVVPVLAAMLGWSRSRTPIRSRWWAPSIWLTFAAAAFLGGGLWYVKNAILAGNPVYPLLGHWLGGETLTADKIDQWNRAHAIPGYSLAGALDSLRDILWQWRLQGWVVVPMMCWGGIVGWRRAEVRVLAASGIFVLAAWWLATHRVERFLLPAAPLAFVLAGIGAAELYRAVPSRVATAILSLLVAMNALYVASPAIGDARVAVDLRYLRSDDESASSVSRLPEHVRWVNQHLEPQHRLLVIGDAAVFDYEIPLAYSTTFDRSPLVEIIERPATEWRRALREAGFSHLLVHWEEIERLRSTYGFDDRITPALFESLERAGAIERLPVELRDGAVEIAVVR